MRKSLRLRPSGTPKSVKYWALVIVAVLLLAGIAVADINVSNSNGAFYARSLTHFCTDPATGLHVSYITYDQMSWTSSSDGVTHSFDIATYQNSSNGYGPDGGVLCGPDDTTTASGYATDGSGYFLEVVNYYHPCVWDPNGNLVINNGGC